MQQNVNNTIITSDRNKIVSMISFKTFLKLQNDGYNNISKKRVLEFVKESCNECCLQNGKITIIEGYGEDMFKKVFKEINKYGTLDSGSYTEWERFNPLMILSIFMIALYNITTSNKSITRELLQDAIKKGYNDLRIDCRAKTYHKRTMLRAIEMTDGMIDLLDDQLISELLNDNNLIQIEYPVQNPNVYRAQDVQQNVQGNRINAIEYIDNDEKKEDDEVEEISRKKRKYS